MVYVRVTFKSSSDSPLTIGNAYIGQAADAGDAYDFQTTPVELLFSGVSGFAIAANTTIVSDAAVYSIPSGKNLVVSAYCSGDASHGNVMKDNTSAGWSNYYKLANDASTVNATGYISNTGAHVVAVSLIEAGYSDSRKNRITLIGVG